MKWRVARACLHSCLCAGLLCLAASAQKPELVLQTGHSKVIHSVVFSPDGRTLASGSHDTTIKLWDVARGQLLRTLAGHTQFVNAVAFSPDGQTLASGSADKTIKLWSVSSGRELGTLLGHTNTVFSVAFSPDGRILASGSQDATIKLWDVATTGRELRTLTGGTGSIDSVAFSPDGRTLVSGGSDAAIKLWDVASGRELRRLASYPHTVSSVAFSPDGHTLASGSSDYNVTLWDVATGRELRVLAGHSNTVDSVAFSPDGRTLASGSWDKTIKLWDVAGGHEQRTLAEGGPAPSVAFSPDGLTLASGGSDRTVKLWNVETGRQLRTLAGQNDQIGAVGFSRDGKTLASGSSDRTVKLWDTGTGRELRTLVGHAGSVGSVAFSPDGLTLASGSSDRTVKLWNVGTGRELRTLVGHTDEVNAISFSPDGKTLASGSKDKTVRLWDIASGHELVTLTGHTDEVEAVAFSRDGRTLASGGWDQTVKLWDIVTRRELGTLAGKTNTVFSVAFNPDGRVLASGSSESIKLWDVGSGRELRTLPGQPGATLSVAFSPDGRTLASGNSDNAVKLWDVGTGRELRTLAGHTGEALSVVFSPDGSILVSGSADNTVKFWDVATGRQVASSLSFADGEWITLIPEGYYSSSAKGDHYLTVRFGNRVYSIDQWRRTFDHPEIVEAALKTRDTREAIASILGSVPATDLSAVGVPEPPSIGIRSPTDGSTLSTAFAGVTFTVEDAQRAIESVSVFVNGRQVGGSGDRGDRLNSPNPNVTKLAIPPGQRRLDLSLPVRLDPGGNRIEVNAFNGIAESRKVVEVSLSEPSSTAAASLPNLWLLSIGVNHYERPQFTSLSYAVEDAEAVAKAFAKQQGKTFGEVHMLLITDKDQLRPTFANITDNLSYLKKAGQFDVVLLFLAGHGLVDSSGDFYFLPEDAALDDEGELRHSRAVSWRELKAVLDVPAKKIILLDACHAEGLTGRKTRDVESDMLVRELQDTRGLIISSSRGKELSQESVEWKHGAFTYALLEGLGGKVNSSNGKITLLALAEYVSRRVPELTNGAQHPIIDTSGGYELFELVQLP